MIEKEKKHMFSARSALPKHAALPKNIRRGRNQCKPESKTNPSAASAIKLPAS